ncbi:MAG TPA: response regulator transcription factor [Burkholderiaceae bacterium]|jgi:DNA-binding NarL/FixJ family response regulator|nr:response regulator transcription factor [Burkholderiaceae bacterium]
MNRRIKKNRTVPALKVKPPRNRRSRISVLLVDPHPILREGIECVLERQTDIRVIASVADASAAIQEAERLQPHVVVMDITMAGMNGIDATRLLTGKRPDIGVVILSIHTSPVIVRRAIEAGALGFLTKDAGTDELLRAVRTAAAGERYISQRLAQGLIDARKATGKSDFTVEVLTATERDILRLVTEGRSNFEVAAAIGLSPRTVETYRGRLMRKLGVENLPSLVRYAIRHGIIPLD